MINLKCSEKECFYHLYQKNECGYIAPLIKRNLDDVWICDTMVGGEKNPHGEGY